MNDRDIDNLLKHAGDAERFANWVENGVEGGVSATPIHAGSGGTGTAWRWGLGGLAAAAAITLGVFMLQSQPQPAPNPIGPIATADPTPLILPVPMEVVPPRPEVPHVFAYEPDPAPPVVTLASQPADKPADMRRWEYLEPEASDGIPSLSDERSVLLAVYHGPHQQCECLAWRLTDDSRFKQANSLVLEQAISSPCLGDAEGVTVYAVSGPRYLLPFHEDDARSLADCLAASPADCFSPEDAVDRIASAASGTSLPDLAASALAMCVPQGLRVTSTTMPLAAR